MAPPFPRLSRLSISGHLLASGLRIAYNMTTPLLTMMVHVPYTVLNKLLSFTSCFHQVPGYRNKKSTSWSMDSSRCFLEDPRPNTLIFIFALAFMSMRLFNCCISYMLCCYNKALNKSNLRKNMFTLADSWMHIHHGGGSMARGPEASGIKKQRKNACAQLASLCSRSGQNLAYLVWLFPLHS